MKKIISVLTIALLVLVGCGSGPKEAVELLEFDFEASEYSDSVEYMFRETIGSDTVAVLYGASDTEKAYAIAYRSESIFPSDGEVYIRDNGVVSCEMGDVEYDSLSNCEEIYNSIYEILENVDRSDRADAAKSVFENKTGFEVY